MARGKTQMKRIENATSRQVTFSKRRNGLLKKAYELSVLCDAEIGLMVFSPSGKLYEFASASMQNILERYHSINTTVREQDNTTVREQDNEGLKRENTHMEDRIRNLESTQRKMLGEGLVTCSMKELNHLEIQVERGLRHIRARKNEILMAQVEQLQRKECMLSDENEFLRQKVLTSTLGFGSVEHIEVETQLDIRPPICIRSSSSEWSSLRSSTYK